MTLDATDRAMVAKFLRGKAKLADARCRLVVISGTMATFLNASVGAALPVMERVSITGDAARDYADRLERKEAA